MRTKIKHAVIIVNYNGWKDTLDCIQSIKNSKDKPHTIVVDSGSTNESVSKLREAYPDLDIVESEENIGFGAANNLGIKKALKMGAQVVHILNNDTIVDPQLFYRAYRYVVGKKRIGVGKIYYAKGYEYHEEQKEKGNIVWYAGGRMDWSTVTARHEGVDEVDEGQFDKPRRVEFATGCYMAVPRQVWYKLDMFDEQLFLYLEDVDLSLRAKERKIEIMYNPHCVIYHRNGGSTGAGSKLVDYYMTRNRFVIGKRYGGIRLRLALFKEAMTRNWKNPVRRRAFLDYMSGKMGKRYETVPTMD